MSFSAFINGETPEQFQHRKKEAAKREFLEQQTKRLMETERVLNILRTIKPTNPELNEKELRSWRESTRRKSLPQFS